MNVGIWHILIVALVVLVLFGRGRISEMMGDFGKGISSFKKGMSEVDEPKARIEPPAAAPAPTAAPAPSEKSDSTGA